MYRKNTRVILFLTISLLFSACATIMHGSRQEMFITCEPRVASVYVDSAYQGETPMVVLLKRGKNHRLRIELPGYQPFETVLTRRLDGWIFGNILLGGFIGVAVDAVSGSMYRLSPRDIYPELMPLPPNGATSSSRVSIKVVLHPDPQWEKIGQLKRETAADSE